MKHISICIPTYEMKGKGHIFLKQSFDSFAKQTFKDFDVVISDHSKNTLIKELCESYREKIDIKYYKNPEKIGNYSFNMNNAIKKAEGKLIKFLLQDDFFFSENSLEEIIKNFDINKDFWLVTACIHTKDRINFYNPFYPKYSSKNYLRKNSIGSPSVLTIKNDKPLLLNENLIWLNDCEYYKRYYDKYGKPKILNSIGVVIGIGDHQITNTIANFKLREKEYFYLISKDGKNFKYWYYKILTPFFLIQYITKKYIKSIYLK